MPQSPSPPFHNKVETYVSIMDTYLDLPKACENQNVRKCECHPMQNTKGHLQEIGKGVGVCFNLPFLHSYGRWANFCIQSYGLVDKAPMNEVVCPVRRVNSSHQWFQESPRETSWNSTRMGWMKKDFIHCGKLTGGARWELESCACTIPYWSSLYTPKKELYHDKWD